MTSTDSTCATACIGLPAELPSKVVQVYATLAEARKWENWLGVAQLVHTAQIEDLQPGNTFCYTSNLAPGFVDGVVQDAEPGKVLPQGHLKTPSGQQSDTSC